MGFSTFSYFVGIYICSVVGFYTFVGVKTFGVLIPDETLPFGSLVAFGILSVGVLILDILGMLTVGGFN